MVLLVTAFDDSADSVFNLSLIIKHELQSSSVICRRFLWSLMHTAALGVVFVLHVWLNMMPILLCCSCSVL